MPNTIDANGLTIKSLSEIITEILNGTGSYPGFYAIYGNQINVGPNSPDGNMINIFAQSAIDMEEFCAEVFASFDPDQATGVVLDQRCAINGVVRRGATYTIQPVLVTVGQAVTLQGLDTSPLSPFTVSDAAGNRFFLVSTAAFGGAGSQTLTFQAAQLGPILTTLNTINQITTPTLGVLTVNNPGAPTTVGISEETDAALRIRRANSVSLPSKGYLEGLLGALLDTDGVTQAIVLENDTNATVGTIPGHSIWCIVLGGSDDDVAHAIYVKRNAGCGMKGSVTVNVPQIDETTFPIQFDRPTSENLWIEFDVVAITGAIDEDYIRAQLLARLSYNIGQSADTATIVALVKLISPNASIEGEGVSADGVTYVSLLAPTAINYQFVLTAPKIIINGNPG